MSAAGERGAVGAAGGGRSGDGSAVREGGRRAVIPSGIRGPVHFVGIGGAGMSALAELLLRGGVPVSGCDARESAGTRRLASLGATLHVGHDPAHVAEAGGVVATAAVPSGHPELAAARARGIPVWKRAELLGEVVNRGRVVAVAGTHGKTSTTALAVHLLAEAGLDPTGFVGGPVHGWGGNLRPGGDLYVVEADEFDRSFLTLEPDVAVVTNLEADHLDVYGDLAGVREGFSRFLARRRPGGRTIVCGDDPGAAQLLGSLPEAGYTYGVAPGNVLRAAEVACGPTGTTFRILEGGRDVGAAHLPVPGRHPLRNALAAAAVARFLGVSWEHIRTGWASFPGVGRRFQRLGEAGGVAVVDDYAHHPTEIAAVLATLRQTYPGRRLVVAFQPHLYTRTRDFAPAFGEALAAADQVWITDVFPAREAAIPGVDGALVASAVTAAGGAVTLHGEVATLAAAMADVLRPGDVVATLGAGSIDSVAPELLGLLRGGEHD
ncbi:MAG: UDP-N-acetylmuramate--L-alanine ligase [Longimicrobiales bacterium]|nr:UDP-N-acetylmuramate--L-alanine ligase [Longimicrobiales bacterium]